MTQNGRPNAYEIIEVKPRVSGMRATEFSVMIDYKESEHLIHSYTLFGEDLRKFWNFLSGVKDD